MKAPEQFETDRLLMRKPQAKDAAIIFKRYATDPEVTRYLSWPTHRSLEDTNRFIEFSDAVWERSPAGPYLIELKENRQLIGGTGLDFKTATTATTGYVFARDAWGKGYATEALAGMVLLATNLGVRLLFTQCHVDHKASRRVLEKCGFTLDMSSPEFIEFPNLGTNRIEDCLTYTRKLGPAV